MTEGHLRAVIYVHAGPDAPMWEKRCLAHVESHDYHLITLVIDEQHGGQWSTVTQLMRDNEIDVCVVGRRDYLPTDRLPRVEVADEDATVRIRARRPGDRRARILDR